MAAASSHLPYRGELPFAGQILIFPLGLLTWQLRAPACIAEGECPIPHGTLRLAAAEGLKAAAIKARMEASYAERDVVRFACSAIDLQMKRIELKLKQADQLEALLQQQRVSLEVRGGLQARGPVGSNPARCGVTSGCMLQTQDTQLHADRMPVDLNCTPGSCDTASLHLCCSVNSALWRS